ncbi:MAG: metallophosphoesterase [Lentisphaeria bacterium]|nr:metallophosphoesterase [Lentisphaeria bacterium]
MKQTKVITLSLAIFIISICCFGYENRILVPKLYNVQITADGKLDEPVWQKAAVFDNLVKTSTHEKVTDKDTQLLMFFDSANVYIGINCQEPTGIISAPINDNSRFWHSDSMEIFFAGLDSPTSDWYNQIAFAVNGIRYNEYIDENDYTLATHVGKNHYSAELIIPLAKFGKFEKDSLRFHFYRHRPAIKESHSWQKLSYSTDLDKFGFLSIFTPENEIIYGPWCYNVQQNCASFGWETAGKVGQSIFYRAKGEKDFHQVPANTQGRTADRNVTLHHVELKNLQNNQVYEYHLGDGKLRTFKTLSSKSENFSFLMLSDLHGKSKTLEAILTDKKNQTADMIFLIGDMVSGMSGRGIIYNGFLDTLVKNWAKPFYYSRGNHEYRGNSPSSYFDMFAKNGKSYQSFSHKGVFFVIIDTDGDVKIGDEYFNEQRQWFQNVVNSNEFKNAEYRVLLSHFPLISTRYGGGKEAWELMGSISETQRNAFDLMLAGHVHQYIKVEPHKDKLYSTNSRWNNVKKTEPWNFPILSCEFGGFMAIEKTRNELQITVIGAEKKLLDKVVVRKK